MVLSILREFFQSLDIRAIYASKKGGEGSRWIFLKSVATEGLVPGCCCWCGWQGQITDHSCISVTMRTWNFSWYHHYLCLLQSRTSDLAGLVHILALKFLQLCHFSPSFRPGAAASQQDCFFPVLGVLRKKGSSPQCTHTCKIFTVKLPPFGKNLYPMHNLKGSGAGSSNNLVIFTEMWFFFLPYTALEIANGFTSL